MGARHCAGSCGGPRVAIGRKVVEMEEFCAIGHESDRPLTKP
jgi:hypothetical protein